MTQFITFKRGGQPGRVAVNPALVTDVRSSAGPFTDIFMGNHQITVEGAFDHVVTMILGRHEADDAPRDLLKRA